MDTFFPTSKQEIRSMEILSIGVGVVLMGGIIWFVFTKIGRSGGTAIKGGKSGGGTSKK
jgi:hypothetical protein